MMNECLKRICLTLLLGAVMACGSGEDVATIECGQGTELSEDGERCVPATQACLPWEVQDARLGTCVPAGETYCGEGTRMDQELGQCVAPSISCGDDAVADDGYCVPDVVVSCGEGTVVSQGSCRPTDEICGDDTQLAEAGEEAPSCRIMPPICGEGTAYDLTDRICVPSSLLRCGVGTRGDDDGFCVPLRQFYEDLADTADVDLGAGDDPVIAVDEVGDRVVFAGTIEAPTADGADLVQHEDRYDLSGGAGQWLEITLYSLGLPEPAFYFAAVDAEERSFSRLSDRASGLEVIRQIVVPWDGSYELTITNMPQFLGELPAAGGDDWRYVGIVEVIAPPPAHPVVQGQPLAGDLRELSENLYALEELEGDDLSLVIGATADHAEGEVQIWHDDQTLAAAIALEPGVIDLGEIGDAQFLLFDRIHGYGWDFGYQASVQKGAPLEAGDTRSETMMVEPGEFLGLFQENLSGQGLRAVIRHGEEVLATVEELPGAGEGHGLYWVAPSGWTADSVTLEVVNTSGEDLEFLSLTTHLDEVGELATFDGSPSTEIFDEFLHRGRRHYFSWAVDEADGLVRLALTQGEGVVAVTPGDDPNAAPVVQGNHATVLAPQPGLYTVYVEATETLDDGFTLSVEGVTDISLAMTGLPAAPIPDDDPDGIDHTLQVGGCPTVTEISADVIIEHTWRGDLIVTLTDPQGITRALKARPGSVPFGDGSNDMIGNFNATLEPVAGDLAQVEVVPIDTFVGTAGDGDWTLNVSDHSEGNTGIFQSWTLRLSCDE